MLANGAMGTNGGSVVFAICAHHEADAVLVKGLQLVLAEVALHYFHIDHVSGPEVHGRLTALPLLVFVDVQVIQTLTASLSIERTLSLAPRTSGVVHHFFVFIFCGLLDPVPLSDFITKRTVIFILLSLNYPKLLVIILFLLPFNLGKHVSFNLVVLIARFAFGFRTVVVLDVYGGCHFTAGKALYVRFDSLVHITPAALLDDLVFQPDTFEIILVINFDSTLAVRNLAILTKRAPVGCFLAGNAVSLLGFQALVDVCVRQSCAFGVHHHLFKTATEALIL